MKHFYFYLLFLLSATGNLAAQNEFITLWDTRLPGVSNNNQILLPTNGNTNFSVTWERLGNAAINGSLMGNGDVLITFPSPGMYWVKITKGIGQFFRFYFPPTSLGILDHDKILEVSQWGDTNWTVCPGFQECSNLNVTAQDAPDFSQITTTQAMFFRCTGLKGTAAFNTWDMSTVTSTRAMFAVCRWFNAPIGNWDVSNVTEMDEMFSGASLFNQDIGDWEVGNVQNFYQMFAGASIFNQDISGWDVSSGTNFQAMFNDAQHFNQPIGSWDVSGASSLYAMFYNATSFNQPIGDWDVSGVTDLTAMFTLATAFNQPLNDWDVGSVASLWGIFLNAQNFNQPLNNWNTENVEDMRALFTNAGNFNQSLGTWDISNVTDMRQALSNSGMSCTNFDETLTGWALNPTVPSNISLGATELYYSNTTSRQYLTDTKGWNITGDTYSANCNGALPVKLIAFTAACHEGITNLEWRTTEEIGFSHFEVERSLDGRSFRTINIIKSGTENGIYHTTDNVSALGNPVVYYRLRMVDLDASYAYSSIVAVKASAGQKYEIYPNPAVAFVNISSLPAESEVRICDLTGKLMYTRRVERESSETVNLGQFTSGLYFVQVWKGEEQLAGCKLIVTK